MERSGKDVPTIEVHEPQKEAQDIVAKLPTNFRRKAPVPKRRRSKQKKRLQVQFDDNITVNEYEDESSSALTEEEQHRQQEILKNMFQDNSQQENSEQGTSWSQNSAWRIASTVVAVSKRLLWSKQAGNIEPASKINHEEAKESSNSELGSSDDDEYDSSSEFNIVYRRSTRQRVRKFSSPILQNNKKTIRSFELAANIDHPKLSSKTGKVPQSSLNPSVATASLKPSLSNHHRRYSSVDTLRDLPGSSDLFRNERNENKPDPFQCFEVEQEPCHILRVRVVRGRNISKGRLQDMLDTPDPYVVVHVRDAPEGRKATRTIDNDVDPVWEEELTYLLPIEIETKIVAEIHLMDSNYSMDEIYGSTEYEVSSLPLGTTVKQTFKFNETSEVDIEFCLEIHNDYDLRLSLALCEEEKKFRSARKRHVHTAMRKLMLEKGDVIPRVMRETPTIAVIGSGGGFRAMTGFSGAMKALHNTGILDCVTYVAGLSGSSWYLATLYAHEDFPQRGTDAVNTQIRDNIQTSPFWLLRPECLMRYSQRLREKMRSGQPVTFTDFFGMLIGQTLLGAKKMNSAKLTDFAIKIKDGRAPMPLLTCLHVRPKTSALTFHDWVEFSPYEIGMAKYGTFMKTHHFGSKFFNGILVKQHDESPLHFLMGVWGSAFSILFNRLVDKSKNNANEDLKNDDVRGEMEKELNDELSNDRHSKNNSDESDGDYEVGGDDDDDDNDVFEDANDEFVSPSEESPKKQSGVFASIWNWGMGRKEEADDSINNQSKETQAPPKPQKGFLNSLVSGVFGADFMESREYRAGKILNYMRGLSLNNTYPLSPFTSLASEKSTIAEEGEFAQIREPIEVQQKRVHLVDAGLTFNSPYPAILRPQRFVDLIISFDFSARPRDNAEPFKEILLAEKWARIHHLPFPKIDRTVYDREGMKECYVFKDETNANAPTIIHFVLCNLNFRNFVKPGVHRSVCDKSADFNIFDTPKSPYSTFNFQYSNEAFDRLHNLMEFNTLMHSDTIVQEIGNCINLRRHSKTRGSISLNDIRKSVYLSAKSRKSLEKQFLGREDGRIYLD